MKGAEFWEKVKTESKIERKESALKKKFEDMHKLCFKFFTIEKRVMNAAHSGWSALQYEEEAMKDFKESTGTDFDLHKELEILKSLPKFNVGTGTERPFGRNAAKKKVKAEKEEVKIEVEKVNAIKERNLILNDLVKAKKRKLEIESMLHVARALEPSPQKTKLMDMALELAMGSHKENSTDDNRNSADQALNF